MLSSSCEFYRHIGMLSVAYHHVIHVTYETCEFGRHIGMLHVTSDHCDFGRHIGMWHGMAGMQVPLTRQSVVSSTDTSACYHHVIHVT
jgi:hypothetical protein